MRATLLIPVTRHLGYDESLKALRLPSLSHRKGDIILSTNFKKYKRN